MKITIRTLKMNWGGFPIILDKEIECEGSGTESDPAVITPSEDLPEKFELRDSNLYVVFQNCYLDHLLVESCRNVTINNCNIWYVSILNNSNCYVTNSMIRRSLNLYDGVNIKIKDCVIKKNLRLVDSSNIMVHDCKLNKLIIRFSNSNHIKSCIIKTIKLFNGRNNILEANKIPKKQLKKIKKKNWDRLYNLQVI